MFEAQLNQDAKNSVQLCKINEKVPQEAISLEDTFSFTQRARVRSSIKARCVELCSAL